MEIKTKKKLDENGKSVKMDQKRELNMSIDADVSMNKRNNMINMSNMSDMRKRKGVKCLTQVISIAVYDRLMLAVLQYLRGFDLSYLTGDALKQQLKQQLKLKTTCNKITYNDSLWIDSLSVNANAQNDSCNFKIG